jgi:hypothetical protein
MEGKPFYAVGENPSAFNVSPTTVGGTSVRLSLIVEDPDAVADRPVAAGGKVVFPLADQPYGMRQGGSPTPKDTAQRQEPALARRRWLLLDLLLVRGDHLLGDV